MRLALLTGGPSPERGISLNSARSIMDHLASPGIEIIPVYFDIKKHAYLISPAQLYSNTPSDFDFKLSRAAKRLSQTALIKTLKSADLVFPAMHGKFGEDGEIQGFLEKHQIPFVGSSSATCKKAFDKFESQKFIKERGFFSIPSLLLTKGQSDHKKTIEKFFHAHHLTRAIVKPARGGSSIGVFSVSLPAEALEKIRYIFASGLDNRAVLQPFAQGMEFTVVLLENNGVSVALPPVEVELTPSQNKFSSSTGLLRPPLADKRGARNDTKGVIFDFRKKYLPTHNVTWHCPPRFHSALIKKIQTRAQQLFTLLGFHDVGRFDGWILPDGNLWFADFNPISGMEQNSFLFHQASRVGMTHSDVLRYIVKNACARHRIPFSRSPLTHTLSPLGRGQGEGRKPVQILMGGATSERQVSLMSGTNVWLKLRQSKKYKPEPFLLDAQNNVWRLPYHVCLSHTVEEVTRQCESYKIKPTFQLPLYCPDRDSKMATCSSACLRDKKNGLETFVQQIRRKLELSLTPTNPNEFFAPEKMSLKQFVRRANFVFIALHGGMGEDGTLQKILENARLPFNGPGAEASKLCIDKWATSEFIKKTNMEGVEAIPGAIIKTKKIINRLITSLGGSKALKQRAGNAWIQDFLARGLFEAGLAAALASTSKRRGRCPELKRGAAEFRSQENPVSKHCLLKQASGKFLPLYPLVVKPRGDGCSTGIARLSCAKDPALYLKFIASGAPFIPANTFKNQNAIIEMPPQAPEYLLFEQFIETDELCVKGAKLVHRPKTGWIEITTGIIEHHGRLHAFNPSITVAQGEVLTVEEKFQGGTGVNITPPPSNIIAPQVLGRIKTRLEKLAARLDLHGYSRIDAFVHAKTGNLKIIEVNTLPGLTHSTVFFHQGLAETPPLYPKELLERLIQNKGY